MADRPTLDEYFIRMALVVATRATCARRQVGCVLVNERGDTLSTGYNGPPSGWPHCTVTPCPGAAARSGEGLDLCEAVHAEMNAVMRCADISRIHTCYCTDSPCLACIKVLLNTSCKRIVYYREYPHELAKARWTRGESGVWGDTFDSLGRLRKRFPRTWEQLNVNL